MQGVEVADDYHERLVIACKDLSDERTHEAADALVPPLAIAHFRSLRSMLWRAENQKIDLAPPATFDERSEDGSCLRSAPA